MLRGAGAEGEAGRRAGAVLAWAQVGVARGGKALEVRDAAVVGKMGRVGEGTAEEAVGWAVGRECCTTKREAIQHALETAACRGQSTSAWEWLAGKWPHPQAGSQPGVQAA